MLLSPQAAQANMIWFDGSADANWATLANWSDTQAGGSTPAVLPGASDDVIFYATSSTQRTPITLGADRSINSLTFAANDTADQTWATTNTLTIGAGGLTVNAASTGAHTLGYIKIGDNQTWTNNVPYTDTLPQQGRISFAADATQKLNLNGKTLNLDGVGIFKFFNRGSGAAGVINLSATIHCAAASSAGKTICIGPTGTELHLKTGSKMMIVYSSSDYGISLDENKLYIDGNTQFGEVNGTGLYRDHAFSFGNAVQQINNNPTITFKAVKTGTSHTFTGYAMKLNSDATLAGTASATFNAGFDTAAVLRTLHINNSSVATSGSLAANSQLILDTTNSTTRSSALNPASTGALGFSGSTVTRDSSYLDLNNGVLAGRGLVNNAGGSNNLGGNRAYGTAGATTVNFANGGGFAALGAALEVALPELTWEATGGQIADAKVLRLGAALANNVVTWSGGIDLGTAAATKQREINVPAGQGGDKAVISGLIRRSGSGAYGIDKTGTGVLEVTNANTYTGPTNVNAGTLKVNNSTGSGTGTGAVAVNSTATLGGNGIIGGNVAINAGGTFAPGNSPGQTTIDNGNLSYASTATYAWEHTAGNAIGITNNSGTATYDQIKLTGTTNGAVTIAAGAAINLTFAGTTVFSDSFWDSNRDWTIISNQNTAGTLSGTFNIGTIAGYSGGGITGEGAFSTVVSGKDLLLHWAAETAGTAIVVTPASGGTVGVDGVSIDATPDAGSYTISGTTLSGAGWTGGGIANGSTSGDKTGPSHSTANRLNGTNMGTLGFTISDATSGGGSYNYTLSTTVSGNTVAAADVTRTGTSRTTFGTVQDATILSTRVAGLAGLNSKTVYTAAGGSDRMIVGTTATVLDSNQLAADTTLQMSWRTRLTDETFAGKTSPSPMGNTAEYLISDVVSVGNVPSNHMYVLQMSYDPNLIDPSSGTESGNANDGLLYLGGWDGSKWVNAGDLGSFTAPDTDGYATGTDFVLGKWGVDLGSHTVWAVVNHGGQFSVIVPEPSTVSLLLVVGLAGLAWRWRRNSKSAVA